MAGMVNQCERAVAFLHQRFPTLPLIVIGHSAGGHLAVRLRPLKIKVSLSFYFGLNYTEIYFVGDVAMDRVGLPRGPKGC